MPKMTDGGMWTKRRVEQHRCNKPDYDNSVSIGDRWRCGVCQTVWVVLKFDFGTEHSIYSTPTIITWEIEEDYNRRNY